ncbi:hypothetical protein A2276_07110 [candidate division WOR-1 bacterium RIFOXYA12_FULL_43_27]|uniref:Uncharacterized protein n=1 Tax=candidate division WOR-1 bacterium RIFOXYC2_FULL_46_14 TaxID=1802587 RepID=A0A1F4U3D4_UNCSA|nr:MAG: hypothetical protein A2276_07110 [candidate division WOR-1 bacterium RIFOXYA12_FULL_43_27]OGC18854.1 MAG: hypothetical protein A2292_07965 [candidate division WOR-1 bacterium RIFOXYB2_FULL_46_45]OGC28995.1 MAG: hypothetical protein A2232_03030 [candidate division WOR-1 bacterium RIFOXYA2_FULL_46_56]OGC39377.1 MAG: hypothetical protein A2438_06645 [candidate division WOR-1 bacterium RIFOXYC2_FULL_46_14]
MIDQSANCKDQSDSVKLKPALKERAYRFGLDIIGMIDLLAKDMSCKVIGNQLLRSATSIGANIITIHIIYPKFPKLNHLVK